MAEKEVTFICIFTRGSYPMIAPKVTVINGTTVREPGKTIQFKGNLYKTSNPEEIEYLRSKSLNRLGVKELKTKEEIDKAREANAPKIIEGMQDTGTSKGKKKKKSKK